MREEKIKLIESLLEMRKTTPLKSVTISYQSGDEHHIVSDDLTRADNPRNTRALSAMEAMILDVIGSGDWYTGQQIADLIKIPKSTTLSVILANLCETGVIESNNRRGYRISQSFN